MNNVKVKPDPQKLSSDSFRAEVEKVLDGLDLEGAATEEDIVRAVQEHFGGMRPHTLVIKSNLGVEILVNQYPGLPNIEVIRYF